MSVSPSQNKFLEQMVGFEPTLSSQQNRSSHRFTGEAISIPIAPTFRRLVGDSGLTGVVTYLPPREREREPGAYSRLPANEMLVCVVSTRVSCVR